MKILKKLGLLLLVLLLSLAIAATWFWRASQAKIDGTLKLPGLSAAVDIVRDAEGVPHIYAKTQNDAIFALGFVHAQDRLWQMEMNRRIASGRMAEILGPAALDTDRFLRTLGVARNAQAILGNLSPEGRGALDAYAKGVNAYLSNRKERHEPLPIEFYLTGTPAPEPWQPADTIGWQTMMSWDLSGNWTQELLRMRLSQKLSLQQINEFLPPYPGDAPLPTQDYTKLYRELAGTAQQLQAVASVAPASLVEGKGSNNWVVSGAMTASGKPLLANDPHLGLSAPALWYFAHLSAPGLNVIGATLPGVPSVVLGRNDRIAWGFTNTGPDVQDLYIERINPANARQYQTPDGWAEFKARTETIKVKGKPDVVMEVRESRHGPVITGALPIADRAPLDAKRYAIAFAWTSLRSDDLTVQAGMKIDRARNWDEFVEAVKDFSSPEQNMVYADVDGNIGYIAPGRIPIRKPENDLKGLAPAPGWDARYDWDGFIPFEALPRQFNPVNNRIYTANQKIVPKDYPYFLTSDWTWPYRADRIGQLLESDEKYSLETFAAMQSDTVSLEAADLLPAMRKTVPGSAAANVAFERLKGWNGEMLADKAEPLIFNAWIRELSLEMFGDKLGDDLMKDYWELRPWTMANVLNNVDGQSSWCENTQRMPHEASRTCADLLANSLDAAVADLQKRYGGDMNTWRWGDAHQARSEHRPFSKVDLLAKVFDVRVATPGDTYTVDVGRYNVRDENEPFVSHHAASLRALYDLSNLENSRFIHSTGQSGNVMSPLYRNFAQRWADVAYVPMKTKRESVEQGKLGVLILTP